MTSTVKSKCPARTTVTADGGHQEVRCKKTNDHARLGLGTNHWGVTTWGMDVVWEDAVLLANMADCPGCEGHGAVAVLPIPDDPQAFEDRPCALCGGSGRLSAGAARRWIVSQSGGGS